MNHQTLPCFYWHFLNLNSAPHTRRSFFIGSFKFPPKYTFSLANCPLCYWFKCLKTYLWQWQLIWNIIFTKFLLQVSLTHSKHFYFIHFALNGQLASSQIQNWNKNIICLSKTLKGIVPVFFFFFFAKIIIINRFRAPYKFNTQKFYNLERKFQTLIYILTFYWKHKLFLHEHEMWNSCMHNK